MQERWASVYEEVHISVWKANDIIPWSVPGQLARNALARLQGPPAAVEMHLDLAFLTGTAMAVVRAPWGAVALGLRYRNSSQQPADGSSSGPTCAARSGVGRQRSAPPARPAPDQTGPDQTRRSCCCSSHVETVELPSASAKCNCVCVRDGEGVWVPSRAGAEALARIALEHQRLSLDGETARRPPPARTPSRASAAGHQFSKLTAALHWALLFTIAPACTFVPPPASLYHLLLLLRLRVYRAFDSPAYPSLLQNPAKTTSVAYQAPSSHFQPRPQRSSSLRATSATMSCAPSLCLLYPSRPASNHAHSDKHAEQAARPARQL